MGGFKTAGHLFPNHPLDVQAYAGIFTWLCYLVDDKTAEMRIDVAPFQECFYAGTPQPSALLQGYAALLRSTKDHFDCVVANFIILSALAFVNSNVLENREEFKSMQPNRDGGKFWDYFRDKDGLAEAYVYMQFCSVHSPDISVFLAAVPDMCVFTKFTNDILS
ncbi:hypothetical protein C8R43DRAFT_1042593 [Mycena crocata]|nr:hypothetical protein C8R43DRAFT_1042593 [Mycena crocata]